MHNLRSQRRGPRRTSAGCPEAGDEEQAWQIGDISCAREYSAAIALAILIAAICFKQTEKISLGPGACGPFLGGVCLSGRASSPVLEGALWAGSPLVGGVCHTAGYFEIWHLRFLAG